MAQNLPIDEGALTKGSGAKLMRSEVVGMRSVARLRRMARDATLAKSDENATMIVDTLWPLVQQGKLAIPRGGIC